jgi:hypothetical protein
MPCLETVDCRLEMSPRSRVPGRERWDIPALRDNPALAGSLELVLCGEAGVLEARASAVTGRLLLRFEPGRISAPVEQLIGAALSFGPLNSLEMRMGNGKPVRRNALRSFLVIELGCVLLKSALFAGRCVPGGAIAATAMFFLFHRQE